MIRVNLLKELKGFKRLSLTPGQTGTVTFHLPIAQLGFCNQHMDYVVEPGVIEVLVGSSSEDIGAHGAFTIVGTTTDVGHSKVFFCSTDVD